MKALPFNTSAKAATQTESRCYELSQLLHFYSVAGKAVSSLRASMEDRSYLDKPEEFEIQLAMLDEAMNGARMAEAKEMINFIESLGQEFFKQTEAFNQVTS